jgi:hypothetical protein
VVVLRELDLPPGAWILSDWPTPLPPLIRLEIAMPTEKRRKSGSSRLKWRTPATLIVIVMATISVLGRGRMLRGAPRSPRLASRRKLAYVVLKEARAWVEKTEDAG